MSGPSEDAVDAAWKAQVWPDNPGVINEKASSRRGLEAAHDGSLGLDRSVRLRDIVERLEHEYRNTTVCGDFQWAITILRTEFGGEDEDGSRGR